MNKKTLLNRINTLYQTEGINITNYLKSLENSSTNSIEDILISYDFQAGSYSKAYEESPEVKRKHLSKLLKVMNEKITNCSSILEVGIGEATSMIEIVNHLNYTPEKIFGFDISWSRVKYAQQITKKYGLLNVELFTADLFNIPFKDNSIELVYTVHALEPNGGREVEALKELYRVSNKYIVLVEPCYEIASDEGKTRMDSLGYVKNLKQTILDLGYNLILDEELENDVNPLNKAKIFVIEKEAEIKNEPKLCCPVTKGSLEKENGCYSSEESLLAYPILMDVPCLLNENAIVATKYSDFK